MEYEYQCQGRPWLAARVIAYLRTAMAAARIADCSSGAGVKSVFVVGVCSGDICICIGIRSEFMNKVGEPRPASAGSKSLDQYV